MPGIITEYVDNLCFNMENSTGINERIFKPFSIKKINQIFSSISSCIHLQIHPKMNQKDYLNPIWNEKTKSIWASASLITLYVLYYNYRVGLSPKTVLSTDNILYRRLR